MKIAVKDLKPNPFKKYINQGKLTPEKIEFLKESIEKDGFWDNILCRKKNNVYEIAYGHHRVEAVRQALGKDYIVHIPCQNLSDEQMLRILGNENNLQNEEYAVYQIDQVVATKKFLEDNPSVSNQWTQTKPHTRTDQGIGSRQISDFLGERNWSKTKVANLLHIADKLHPKIMSVLRNVPNAGTPKENTTISLAHGQRLSRLDDKKDQLKAFKLIKQHNLSTREADVVVDKIKQEKEITLSAIKKEKRSDYPMIEEVIHKTVKQLNKTLVTLKQVLKHKKDIRPGSRKLLESCLSEYRKHINNYFEEE